MKISIKIEMKKCKKMLVLNSFKFKGVVHVSQEEKIFVGNRDKLLHVYDSKGVFLRRFELPWPVEKIIEFGSCLYLICSYYVYEVSDDLHIRKFLEMERCIETIAFTDDYLAIVSRWGLIYIVSQDAKVLMTEFHFEMGDEPVYGVLVINNKVIIAHDCAIKIFDWSGELEKNIRDPEEIGEIGQHFGGYIFEHSGFIYLTHPLGQMYKLDLEGNVLAKFGSHVSHLSAAEENGLFVCEQLFKGTFGEYWFRISKIINDKYDHLTTIQLPEKSKYSNYSQLWVIDDVIYVLFMHRLYKIGLFRLKDFLVLNHKTKNNIMTYFLIIQRLKRFIPLEISEKLCSYLVEL